MRDYREGSASPNGRHCSHPPRHTIDTCVKEMDLESPNYSDGRNGKAKPCLNQSRLKESRGGPCRGVLGKKRSSMLWMERNLLLLRLTGEAKSRWSVQRTREMALASLSTCSSFLEFW